MRAVRTATEWGDNGARAPQALALGHWAITLGPRGHVKGVR